MLQDNDHHLARLHAGGGQCIGIAGRAVDQITIGEANIRLARLEQVERRPFG